MTEEQDNRVYHALLTKVGLQGEYQTNVIKILILISLIGSSTFFVNTYLFYQPPYDCKGTSNTCTQFVCSLPIEQRKQYLPNEQITTLANFNGDNRCQTLSDVTAMQEAMLLGASLGLFIGVLISDAIGRRLTIIYSMVFTVVGILLVLAINSIKIKCIGLVMWGSGAQISFTLIFPVITQKLHQNARSDGYVKLNAAFAAGATANAIVFYIFKNWVLVLVFYYCLLFVVATILFYLYVESPPIQIISKSNSPEQAYQTFMRIAERNKVSNHDITLEEMTVVYERYHDNQLKKDHAHFFTFIDLLRFESLRTDFFKVGFSFFILMFLLYAPVLLLDKLFSNIFLNGIINGLSQFITLPVLSIIIPKLSRRVGIMTMFGSFTVFTLFQFFINKQDCLTCNSVIQDIFILIFFFTARFFINLSSNFFVCIMNETFPAQIRSISPLAIVGVGRLSTLTIPFIPMLKQHLSISYNLFFSIVGSLGVLSGYLMKETINTLPPEMIKELEMQEYNYSKLEAKKGNI